MKRCLTVIAFIFTLVLCAQEKPEVIYHINQQHFFGGDDKGYSDMKGLQQKLGYLEQLGITSILLPPVYEVNDKGYSDNDLMVVNPKLGLLADYRNLVVEAHKKNMKVYQVLNLQYVGTNHKWFKESYKKTASEYARFIYYADDKNEKPVYLKEKSVAVNLHEPKVREYLLGMLKQWADPNKDKLFNDGVDGFVLDMADKTPGAPKLINLYDNFWKPLIDEIKVYNPKIKIMAQQDMESLAKGSAERAFSKSLEKAIASLDKNKIIAVADTTFKKLPEPGQVLLYAVVADNAEKNKVAAALSLFIGGVPVLPSGQETEAKDMDWKNVEEQAKDNNSTLSYYKQLIKAYKTDPGLSKGRYKEIVNSSNDVVSFTRTYKNITTLVMINLSGVEQPVIINDTKLKLNAAKVIFGIPSIEFPRGGRGIVLPPNAVQAYRIVTGPSR